jgi:hypothetical protein
MTGRYGTFWSTARLYIVLYSLTATTGSTCTRNTFKIKDFANQPPSSKIEGLKVYKIFLQFRISRRRQFVHKIVLPPKQGKILF